MILKEVQHSSSCGFGIDFPEADEGSAGAAGAPNLSMDRIRNASRLAGEPVTVLLADDRSNLRQAFGTYFRPDDGIAVIGDAADDGDVLGKAEKLRPHVVVIAMRMALRIGLETLGRMLKTRCGSELIVLLPHRECPFVNHVTVAGAAGYLTEQDTSELMAAVIRKVRGKSKANPRGFSRHAGTVPTKDATSLTTREQEVLKMIAEGRTNKAIAADICISIKTVEKHRQHVMDKLGIHETATLTRYALYAGYLY